jgi:hypothetical protein
VGLSERGAVAALLGLEAACAGLGLAVVAEKSALATGAALGLVFALLIALCSRLTLVTEQTIDLGEAAPDEGRAPLKHAALARETDALDEFETAVVDLTGERQEKEGKRRARELALQRQSSSPLPALPVWPTPVAPLTIAGSDEF